MGTQALVQSAARTTSGSSAAVAGYAAATTLRAQLNVTASGGTSPTLDVTIEDSLDGTNWNPIGTFTQKIAPGREVINVTTPFADRVRASWVVAGGGGQTFTFDVLVFDE